MKRTPIEVTTKVEAVLERSKKLGGRTMGRIEKFKEVKYSWTVESSGKWIDSKHSNWIQLVSLISCLNFQNFLAFGYSPSIVEISLEFVLTFLPGIAVSLTGLPDNSLCILLNDPLEIHFFQPDHFHFFIVKLWAFLPLYSQDYLSSRRHPSSEPRVVFLAPNYLAIYVPLYSLLLLMRLPSLEIEAIQLPDLDETK